MVGFIYYKKNTKDFVGKSGYPVLSHVTGEEMIKKEVIPEHGGNIEDYSYIKIETIEKMRECYNAGSIEIVDEKNFILYDKVKLTHQLSAEVNEIVDIQTTHEATLYIDQEEQTAGTEWQVQFETAGEYEIKVDANKYGTVTRQVVVV